MNLHQRLANVRSRVDYLKKDKQVQGYKAVTHDAVTAYVRNHLIEQGVLIYPPSVIKSHVVDTGHVTNSGTTIIRYEATYTIAFVNIDEPQDKIVVEIEAHANDTGDKAPGKAMSYAKKYAVLKMFEIETGEEEEGRLEGVNREVQAITEAIEQYQEYISKIVEYINADNLSGAAEVYSEIPKEALMSIWIAPTKARKLGIDPPFTTQERAIIKSDEFGALIREYKQGKQQ